MTTNHTPPATREFCVYATDVLYQHVEATSAEQAFRIATRNPSFESCGNSLRLDRDVKDIGQDEFIRVGVTAAHCKTCGSEIVATVNDSTFRDGECGACEYRRYQSQPALLTALLYMLEQTVEMDLAHGITLTEGETDARRKALSAIAHANG